MATNSINTELRFTGKDDASAKIDGINKKLKQTADAGLSLNKVFAGTFLGLSAQQAMARMAREVGYMAKSFVVAANDTENLREQLTLITGTRADAILASIRSEIGQMPVSLNAATEAYVSLRAGGIEPAMRDLKALADLVANMKGDPNATMGTLADSLGRLSAMTDLGSDSINRYLLTLTQQGIPVAEILRDKLNLTADAMGNMTKAGVTGRDIVGALFSWMRDQQGKTEDGFDDLAQKMKNAWEEMQRQAMEAGPFRVMKQSMTELLEYVNSNQGKLDIRELMIDVADGVVAAFQRMTEAAEMLFRAYQNVSGLGKGIRFIAADAKVTEYEDKAKVLTEQILAGEQWQRLGGTGARAKWIASGKPYFTTEVIAQKREELAQVETYLKALRQAQEDAAKAFGSVTFPGEESRSGNVFARIQEQLATARAGLRSGGGAPSPSGQGLPAVTTFTGAGGQADYSALEQAMAKIAAEWAELDRKYAEEVARTHESLTDNIKRLTLSQSDYQRWALDQELGRLQDYAASSKEAADDVAQYRTAKLAEIERAEAESARAVQDQIEAIRRKAAVPQGRFATARAGVLSEYQAAARGVEEQVANKTRTPEQAAAINAALAAAQAQELAEINLQASNDVAAGWERGMQNSLDAMRSGFEQAKELAQETAQAMQQSFSDFFFDVMQGNMKTFSDYMTSFLSSIQRAIANIAGQMATQAILSSASSYFGFSLPKMAEGGIVTRPTVALIGEAGPEAIVPLSGARAAAAPPVTVNVINQSGSEMQATTSQPRMDAEGWVIDVVLDGVARNRRGLRTALALA